MKTLVICPLKKELTDFLHTVRKYDYETHPLKAPDRAIHEIPKLNMLAATGGHGKVNMALSTQQMILDYPNIERVICLGTGGSLGAPAKVLDVVVASKVIEHDYKTLFHDESSVSPEFETFVTEQNVRNLKESLVGAFGIHYEPIASGDEDIVSNDRAAELREFTQAYGVAWEGAGAARAAKKHDKEFLEIRGLSDSADSEASFDYAKNLPKAVGNATEVLLHLLT